MSPTDSISGLFQVVAERFMIEALYYMLLNDTLEFGRDITSNPNLSFMPAPGVISKDVNFFKEKHGVFYI